MAKRLLPPTKITSNFRQRDEEVVDFGAYKTLEIGVRVLKTGAGDVLLEHSATKEPDSWRTLAGTTFALSGAGGYVSVPNFLRYVRAGGSAGADGTGLPVIDIVAKE